MKAPGSGWPFLLRCLGTLPFFHASELYVFSLERDYREIKRKYNSLPNPFALLAMRKADEMLGRQWTVKKAGVLAEDGWGLNVKDTGQKL